MRLGINHRDNGGASTKAANAARNAVRCRISLGSQSSIARLPSSAVHLHVHMSVEWQLWRCISEGLGGGVADGHDQALRSHRVALTMCRPVARTTVPGQKTPLKSRLSESKLFLPPLRLNLGGKKGGEGGQRGVFAKPHRIASGYWCPLRLQVAICLDVHPLISVVSNDFIPALVPHTPCGGPSASCHFAVHVHANSP